MHPIIALLLVAVASVAQDISCNTLVGNYTGEGGYWAAVQGCSSCVRQTGCGFCLSTFSCESLPGNGEFGTCEPSDLIFGDVSSCPG